MELYDMKHECFSLDKKSFDFVMNQNGHELIVVVYNEDEPHKCHQLPIVGFNGQI